MLIILSVTCITIIYSEREEIIILTAGTRVPLGEVTVIGEECILTGCFHGGRWGLRDIMKYKWYLTSSAQVRQNSGPGKRTGKKEEKRRYGEVQGKTTTWQKVIFTRQRKVRKWKSDWRAFEKKDA